MCVPVQTLSFIRQVMHTKFNCSDVSLHGPDTQASYSVNQFSHSDISLQGLDAQSLDMEIACS
jgi:hypothetical protein